MIMALPREGGMSYSSLNVGIRSRDMGIALYNEKTNQKKKKKSWNWGIMATPIEWLNTGMRLD